VRENFTTYRNVEMANEKNKPMKCEVELNCKATAALEEEIKEDLVAEDKSLEELIQNEKSKEETDS
tara:strand:+ start:230 stop:427 length:198 start_codon:yes stop_codon:yes gene_type:complete